MLLVPLSAAAVPQPGAQAVDPLVWALPADVQAQLQTVVAAHPEMASAVEHLEPSASQQAAGLVQKAGTNTTLIEKLWRLVMDYREARFLLSVVIYARFSQSKFMMWRVLTWGIKVLKWTKVGILLGFVTPPLPPPPTPSITFQGDVVNRTILVVTADPGVPWSDIGQIGNGTCNPFPTGNVTAGDMITNCSGNIALMYIPNGVIMYNQVFP